MSQVILHLIDGLYSSPSSLIDANIFDLRKLHLLLTSKFKRQSQNMQRYLELQNNYLDFIADGFKTSYKIPLFCPIDFIRDGKMFAEILEEFSDYFVQLKSDGFNFMPFNDAICINDREIFLRLISVSDKMFALGSEELRGDKEMVRALLNSKIKSFNVFQYLTDEFQFQNNDIEFILEFEELRFRHLFGDREEWITKLIEENDHIYWSLAYSDGFKNLSLETRSNKCKMMQSLKHNGDFFAFISEDLKHDREIIIRAVSSSGMSLKLMNECYRKDKQIVECAFTQNPNSFQFAHESLKEDSEFVLKLIKLNPSNSESLFHQVSTKLKSNPEFCLKFLETNPNLRLILTNSVFGNNREFIMNALQVIHGRDSQNYGFVDKLNENLRNDKELILKSLKVNIHNFTSIGRELIQDKDILSFMAQNGKLSTFNFSPYTPIPEEIKNDREFWKALFSNKVFNDDWFKRMPPHFLEEESLLEILLTNHAFMINTFPNQKQLDLIRKYPTCLFSIKSSQIQIEQIDLLIQTLEKEPNYFIPLQENVKKLILQKNKKLVMEICKKNIYLFQRLHLPLELDIEFVLPCVYKYLGALFEDSVAESVNPLNGIHKKVTETYGKSSEYLKFMKELPPKLSPIKEYVYFPLVNSMNATELEFLFSKRIEIGYGSDFHLPKNHSTLDFKKEK